MIVDRRADEEPTTGGRRASSLIVGAGLLQALGAQLGIFAEIALPDILPAVHVERAQSTLGRGLRRITVGVEEAHIA